MTVGHAGNPAAQLSLAANLAVTDNLIEAVIHHALFRQQEDVAFAGPEHARHHR